MIENAHKHIEKAKGRKTRGKNHHDTQKGESQNPQAQTRAKT
jgi:hypothetical protein